MIQTLVDIRYNCNMEIVIFVLFKISKVEGNYRKKG